MSQTSFALKSQQSPHQSLTQQAQGRLTQEAQAVAMMIQPLAHAYTITNVQPIVRHVLLVSAGALD